ncbi:MAG: PorV/PorQ family protein [Ignavibacteria bacterium]|jgi:hypothetical protein
MCHRIFVIVLVCIAFSGKIYAQGGTAVPFLLIKPGATPNGLAGSYTALAHGGFAMYYNPAGLAQTNNFSSTFSYSDWLSDLFDGMFTIYSAAVYTVPNIGSFGLSIQYMDFGNFINQSDVCISAGYGRQFSKTLSGGITIKYIHSKLYSPFPTEGSLRNLSANAVAFDLGILFTNFLPELCYSQDMAEEMDDFVVRKINKNKGPSLGISLSNMGNEIYYLDADQADPLPQNLRVGLAWTIVNNDLLGITVSTDILKLLIQKDIDTGDPDSFPESLITSWENFTFEELEFSLGVELDITALLTLRAGRFFEDENYGNRNYYTYGFSVGPEFARFSISFFDTTEKNHPLDGTIFFEGEVRL